MNATSGEAAKRRAGHYKDLSWVYVYAKLFKRCLLMSQVDIVNAIIGCQNVETFPKENRPFLLQMAASHMSIR